MASAPSPGALVSELSAHPRADALVARVVAAALGAAEARRRSFAASGDGSPGEPEGELAGEQAETRFGNPLEILARGAQTAGERELVGALLAIGVARRLPSAPESELELAARLVWLATHTPCNAFVAADAALGESSPALWRSVSRLVDEPTLGGSDFGRAEALVAAAALASSDSPVARELLAELGKRHDDPLFRALVGARTSTEELRGELLTPPRSPLVTALYAVTLWLLVEHAAHLVGRYALAYKRPARLRLSERGIELSERTELLGRVLRDREVVVPFGQLLRVTREVRYARVGLYAGLLALVLGSYFGMGLLVDGLRVPGGSPPLLGMALLLIALGIAVDFGLSSLSDTVRGKCRLVVVPRKGRALSIGSLDPARADAMLKSVAGRAASAVDDRVRAH